MLTVVTYGNQCLSACVMAFVGGTIRAHDDGIFAVHQSKLRDENQLDPELKEMVGFMTIGMKAVYLQKMGIDQGLMQPTMQTAHEDAYVLSEDELRRFNIINADFDTLGLLPDEQEAVEAPTIDRPVKSAAAALSHTRTMTPEETRSRFENSTDFLQSVDPPAPKPKPATN